MPAFVDTMTFGGQMLVLDGKTTAFAGSEYNKTNKGVFEAIDGSKGVNLGDLLGNFKDRYHLRLLVCEAFTGASASKVEVKLYSSNATSEKCTADDEKLCLTIPVETFNKCTQTPYEISLPPDVCKYNIIGFRVLNGSGSAVEIATGSVIVTVEDKRW